MGCAVQGCTDQGRLIRGWCYRHWRRWKVHGDPLKGVVRYEWPDNLLRRTAPQPDGCIHYTGEIDDGGYGRVSRHGSKVSAHRAAYEMFVGPIPEGHELDHACHDPDTCRGGDTCLHRRCVNVDHLLPTTPQENTLRSNSPAARKSRQTHCIHGHEFTPENTYRTDKGNRRCRRCIADAQARYQGRKRAARLG